VFEDVGVLAFEDIYSFPACPMELRHRSSIIKISTQLSFGVSQPLGR
jgi:hypothetical protein